jgi:hypothetical protein
MNSYSWLIRHPDLTFSGPMSKAELVRKIESGEVLIQDEICTGGGYWFSIQEVDEVTKFFGEIRLQSMIPSHQETTSSTNTAPLAQAAEKLVRELKVASKAPKEEVEQATPSPLLLGFFVALIFFGILGILWIESH